MRARFIALFSLVAASGGCALTPRHVAQSPLPAPPVGAEVKQDSAPKEELRLVPAEAYLRTYLVLFGGLTPTEVQAKARGGGLFDSWDDYFLALGFPDYRLDLPRGTQTNGLMIATFERLGVALCDRAVEHDLKAKPPPASRTVFAFEPTPGPPDAAGFASRFDVLHRTFLGYPATLGPPERVGRFFKLYSEVARLHAKVGAAKTRFSPDEAGWAAVCYGLVRHPEFHLY